MKDVQKIRLNRYLQRYEGISRRHADEMIKEGRIRIDEQTAELGVQVQIGKDKVTLDGREIKPAHKPFSYIVMNKPNGYICSRKGYRTVFELLPERFKSLSYIGRLDVNTTGALLLPMTEIFPIDCCEAGSREIISLRSTRLSMIMPVKF